MPGKLPRCLLLSSEEDKEEKSRDDLRRWNPVSSNHFTLAPTGGNVTFPPFHAILFPNHLTFVFVYSCICVFCICVTERDNKDIWPAIRAVIRPGVCCASRPFCSSISLFFCPNPACHVVTYKYYRFTFPSHIVTHTHIYGL